MSRSCLFFTSRPAPAAASAPAEPAPQLEQTAAAEAPENGAGAAPPPPAPAEVTPRGGGKMPVVATVPTSNIKERISFDNPRWLTGALIVVPLIALFALGNSATGACGEATVLRTDVITGEIVNCDGSEFTGQVVGGGGEFLALGESVYSGGAVAGVNCAAAMPAPG